MESLMMWLESVLTGSEDIKEDFNKSRGHNEHEQRVWNSDYNNSLSVIMVAGFKNKYIVAVTRNVPNKIVKTFVQGFNDKSKADELFNLSVSKCEQVKAVL